MHHNKIELLKYRTRGFRGESFHVGQKRSLFFIRRDISFGSER